MIVGLYDFTWWRTIFSLFFIAPQYDILNFCLTYFHVSNRALLCAQYFSTLILHRYSLDAFDWMGASFQIEFSKIVIISPSFIDYFCLWEVSKHDGNPPLHSDFSQWLACICPLGGQLQMSQRGFLTSEMVGSNGRAGSWTRNGFHL